MATANAHCELIEEIVRALRARREALERLFVEPGQLVIHLNPNAKADRVRIEARVKV